MIYRIIVTLVIGIAFGCIAIKLKIPAGGMLGALFAVAVFNVFTGEAYLPSQAKVFTQTISGLFIGCKISRSELKSLKTLIKPAILNMSLIILACLGMGVCLYFVSDYNMATCAFATAPGSMTDMAIISVDMGADTSVVSVLQLVRLITILGLFPTLFGAIIKKVAKKHPEAVSAGRSKTELAAGDGPEKSWKNILITILVAAAGGAAGSLSGVPAGPLIFSMVFVGVQNVLTGTAYMPINMKRFAQICAGVLIGESVTMEAVVNLRYSIVPALVMIFCLMGIVLLLAFILYKTSGIDFVTALFACAPGGASDLALIAGDFGASTPKVSIIQTLRVVCVVVIYPVAIQLLNGWLG